MEEEKKSNSSKKNPKKTWLIVLAVVIALALIIGAFFLGKILTGKSLKLVSETPTPSPTATPTATAKKTAAPTPTPEDTAPAGMKIFRNEDYGYQVTYPENATISFADEAGLEGTGLKSNKVCVTIKNDYMFVNISAKENKDGKYLCHRTGVGADEINNTPEQITVLGKTYTASGFMFASVSMRILNSDWMFDLDDGTNFDYGISLDTNTYNDPGEAKAHAQARAVVESFKGL